MQGLYRYAFLVYPDLKKNNKKYIRIRNSRRLGDVCRGLAGVFSGSGLFHQELSIRPLWPVGKPVGKVTGSWSPAAAGSPPQRIFFLVLFLLEVAGCCKMF